MFFSESGLWLSNYCYNVGGGGVGVTAPKAVAQYFLRPDDTYDWSSDKAGVTFLKMAQDHNVPYITFFVSSAPPSIFLNKTSCGWDMTSRQVQPFANYLTTIVSHWKNEGINVTYISSMNEPINNRECCGQEVMGVSVFLRGPVFVALNAALRNASTSDVGIIGDETYWAVEADAEYPVWLPRAKTPSQLSPSIITISRPMASSLPTPGLHVQPQGSPFLLLRPVALPQVVLVHRNTTQPLRALCSPHDMFGRPSRLPTRSPLTGGSHFPG
jgi:hypothetical protein